MAEFRTGNAAALVIERTPRRAASYHYGVIATFITPSRRFVKMR